MNTKQIIDDFDEYGDEISKKLSANHWRPYFLIKEKFSNIILMTNLKIVSVVFI